MYFYEPLCSRGAGGNSVAECVRSAGSGHEDTWFLVEIPQRERFMSCREESCTVVNHES